MYAFRNHAITTDTVPLDQTAAWHAAQPAGVSVHTGFPNPAIDTNRPELDLNQLLIAHQAGTYLMRIEGADWVQSGLFDGDIAIVDRVITPAQNDVVIWWYDGDFVIGPRCRMHPEATVWGTVTATVHQFRKVTA